MSSEPLGPLVSKHRYRLARYLAFGCLGALAPVMGTALLIGALLGHDTLGAFLISLPMVVVLAYGSAILLHDFFFGGVDLHRDGLLIHERWRRSVSVPFADVISFEQETPSSGRHVATYRLSHASGDTVISPLLSGFGNLEKSLREHLETEPPQTERGTSEKAHEV